MEEVSGDTDFPSRSTYKQNLKAVAMVKSALRRHLLNTYEAVE